MCGRYRFLNGANPRFEEWIQKTKEKMPPKQFEQLSFEDIFPSSFAFVGFLDPKDIRLKTKLMKWGFQNRNSLVINARSETCFTSPFYEGCIPCTVPASGYYEWTKEKEKYFFTIDQEMYLAGVARIENNEWHFVILTEEAVGNQRLIHTREPVVFHRDDAKKWNLSKDPTSLLSCSIKERTQTKV